MNMMQEGALTMAEASVKKIAIPIRKSRRIAIMNMAAAGMALVAAGIVLWTMMKMR